MSDFLKEDYYYCNTNWLKEDNPTRVFRVKEIYQDTEGINYFVPMMDEVFVTNEKHADSAGNIYVDNYLSQFREATLDEVEDYVMKAYERYPGTMQLHDNNHILIRLFKDMKKEFEKRRAFKDALEELKEFPNKEIYNSDEKYLLNLLRSYYKCRILKK